MNGKLVCMEEGLVIHTDGGARGNPGPGACAFVASKNGETLFKAAKFLGKTTNNVAEYQGVILALNWFLSDPQNTSRYSLINFFLDSELVVRQLTGIYKVKDEKIRELFFEIKSLLEKTKVKYSFNNIPREKNKLADFLVNENLDANP